MVGARGFWRARLHVSGGGGHSGSRRQPPDNAVVKAATLVRWLTELELPSPDGGDFPLGPRLTVTGISGGEGYSIVPDRCAVSVDIRLTPRCGAAWADRLVRDLCRSVDEAIPSRAATTVEPDATWPAYRLPGRSPIARALRDAARRALGRDVPAVVAGPSNIGNYLVTTGIEATCGFGLTYRNLHAADEAVDLTTLPAVYAAYGAAVRTLLEPSD